MEPSRPTLLSLTPQSIETLSTNWRLQITDFITTISDRHH